MGIVVKSKAGNFTPAPEGNYQSVLVDVVDIGEVTSNFGTRDLVELRFQIDEIEKKSMKAFLVTQRYSKSLHKKSNLRPVVEALYGRALTDEEAERGIDLDSLIGCNCMVQVTHNISDKGGTFANASAVTTKPAKLPDIRAMEYTRVQDREPVSGEAEKPAAAVTAGSTEDDDIPFN